jgi:2-polyprenyl-3-methyl-5-hydroxy-6-metoxy-1,4-benzoquinol methylase
VPLFEKEGDPYERCRRCGLATRGGAGSPPSYHDYFPEMTRTLPPLTRRRYEALLARLARYREGGRFLDVGCGGGFLVETARDLGWAAEGTEVSRSAVDFGRGKGLTIHVGVLADANLPAAAFDAITLMEVVEHVPDPVALLRECTALLRPGGALYLTTPNWGSLSRRLLGARWSPVSRDHVVYFTPRHIRRALAAAGLRPVRVTSANVQPHEILACLRRDSPPPQQSSLERTMALRDSVESNPVLRVAKSCVNAALAATGTGDTLRALAVREPRTR